MIIMVVQEMNRQTDKVKQWSKQVNQKEQEMLLKEVGASNLVDSETPSSSWFFFAFFSPSLSLREKFDYMICRSYA